MGDGFVLTVRVGQTWSIGDSEFTVVRIKGQQIWLRIKSPSGERVVKVKAREDAK